MAAILLILGFRKDRDLKRGCGWSEDPAPAAFLSGAAAWNESVCWVASRVGMGHEVGVTRAVRRFRENPKLAERLKALEKKLED